MTELLYTLFALSITYSAMLFVQVVDYLIRLDKAIAFHNRWSDIEFHPDDIPSVWDIVKNHITKHFKLLKR